MGQFGQNPHTSDYIDGLKGELEVITAPARRLPVLYALLRLLERRPGRREEAYGYLDEALTHDPDSPDLIFEAWRAAFHRTPEKKLSVLSALLPLIDAKEDLLHCRLLRAQLFDELNDAEAAKTELDTADALVSDRREVAWARLLIQAAKDPKTLAEGLEDIAVQSEDPVFEAALLLEAADLKRAAGADTDEIDRLLSLILAIPELDWSLLEAVYRLAVQQHLWGTAAQALEKMAQQELTPSDPDPSAGDFRGFDVGHGRAASTHWLRALLLHTRLGETSAALEAVVAARKLLPENRHLYLAAALLEEAMGASGKALELLRKTEVPRERKALLSLAVRAFDEVLAVGAALREKPGGRFAEWLTEAAADTPPPPSSQASVEVRLSWLASAPSHPEAPRVAAELSNEGVSTPLLCLYAEEAESPDTPLLAVVEAAGDTAWRHALTAFLGPPSTRADALLALAEHTDDIFLKMTFIRTALALLPPDTEPAADLDRQLADLEDATVHPDIRFEPSPSSWRQADEQIPIPSHASEHDGAAVTALFKKVLIKLFAAADPKGAKALIDTLLEIYPSNPATLLLALVRAAMARDWNEAADHISSLSAAASEDASLFAFLLGELDLVVAKNYPAALASFERCTDTPLSQAYEMASIYRLLTLHQMGKKDEIDALLAPPATATTKGEGLFADLFDDVFEDATHQSVLCTLEGAADDATQAHLNRLVFTAIDPDRAEAELEATSQILHAIEATSDDRRTRDALHATAALIDNQPFALDDAASADNDELVFYTGLGLDIGKTDGQSALQRHTPRSLPCDDLEQIDRLLTRAEIQAETGDYATALDTLHAAMKIAPDHPGLNETHAILAPLAGRFVEAVDAHARLAQIYDSAEEQTHHLAKAALLLLDKLNLPGSARNICLEAMRRSEEHAKSNDVIAYVLDASQELVQHALAADPGTERERPSLIPPESEDEVADTEREIRRLMANDEDADALRLVNDLMVQDPGRVSLHRYKLNILTHEKRWEEALIAAELYLEVARQTEERRSIVIRAATIASDLLNDPVCAILWLKRLRARGAPFPEAEKRIFDLATLAGLPEEAAKAEAVIRTLAKQNPDDTGVQVLLAKMPPGGGEEP